MVSTSYSQRQEMRRFRNRTLDTSSGLVGLGRSGSALGHHHGMGGPGAALDHFLQQRPSSATGLRSITPSFNSAGGLGEKENGQNFVDFNPAGRKSEIYKYGLNLHSTSMKKYPYLFGYTKAIVS